MRLLAFGGWGQLGSELAVVCEGRHQLQRPTRAEVDVQDGRAVEEAVRRGGPDAVVNLAAFHKVERCEEDPAQAFAVNAVGAWQVARAAAGAGARSVFISSDYVFDGEDPQGYGEGASTRPVNVYGVSKAAGERLVALACPDSMIARGSSLFGHAGSSGKGGNFVETVLAKAGAGEALAIVDDVTMSPTGARDMAERIVLLLEREAPPGTYHLANAGGCSWFEFAAAILDLAGLPADLGRRSSRGDVVQRPRCSVLLDTKSTSLGLPPARPWREALAWYLANRPAAARTGARAPVRPAP